MMPQVRLAALSGCAKQLSPLQHPSQQPASTESIPLPSATHSMRTWLHVALPSTWDPFLLLCCGRTACILASLTHKTRMLTHPVHML
jgi:hypothetical protein